MPVVITFDIKGATEGEHNRIQSFFERFGWENLGGSSYRYPRLGSDQPTEDWFNHVIPALMLFRSYTLKHKRLKKFTLDIQSSTGYHPEGYGTPPAESDDVHLYVPTNKQFGEKNLRKWLEELEYPY